MRLRGFLLGLELALEADEVALGQFHFFRDLLLQFYDERFETSRTVGVDAPMTKRRWLFSRLMTLGPLASRTSATRRQRDALAVPPVFDEELAEFVRRVAPFQRQAHDEVHGALAFAQLGDVLAADRARELFVDVRRARCRRRGRARGSPRCGAAGWTTCWSSLHVLEAGDGFGDGLNLDADLRAACRGRGRRS